jgi:hypothetical protein
VACGFFTADTIGLTRAHVVFFIDLATRRILQISVTEHPDDHWVTQQVDAVLASEGIAWVRTPFRSPQASADAERWVGSARRECQEPAE